MLSFFCLGIVLLQQNLALANIYDSPVDDLAEIQERAEGPSWSYVGPDGTDTWSKNYKTCGGNAQSPIRIKKLQAKNADMDAIRFHGYDTIRSGMTIENNGHSAQLHLSEDDEDKPYIEFGGLGAKYTFSQLHFHWGRDNSEGTEHILKPRFGRSLEAHFVHVNPDEAQDGRAGIAVLGILFNANPFNNKDYAPLVDVLKDIQYKGQKTTILKDVKLDSLLPNWIHRNHFFRYNGSLTTPPCTEGVIWTVFEHIESIGRAQVQEFRNLMRTPEGSENPESMTPNFRPVQPLNGRPVYIVHSRRQND